MITLLITEHNGKQLSIYLNFQKYAPLALVLAFCSRPPGNTGSLNLGS